VEDEGRVVVLREHSLKGIEANQITELPIQTGINPQEVKTIENLPASRDKSLPAREGTRSMEMEEEINNMGMLKDVQEARGLRVIKDVQEILEAG